MGWGQKESGDPPTLQRLDDWGSNKGTLPWIEPTKKTDTYEFTIIVVVF